MDTWRGLFQPEEERDDPFQRSLLTTDPLSPRRATTTSQYEGLFAPREGVSVFGSNPQLEVYEQRRARQENRRNILDRVFAPFEAPQQALFAFTVGVGQDGFQFKDITSSLGHGIRYANPWSEEARIDPEEVRRTVFGEWNNQAGRGAANIAISLLFDPLLLLPATKALGLMRQGNRYEQIVERIGTSAFETVSGAFSSVARRVVGDEAAEQLRVRLGRLFVSKYYGLPDEFRQELMALDQNVQTWRNEAFSIFRRARKLGGTEANVLMSEALETENIGRALFEGGREAVRQQNEWRAIMNRGQKLGINEDLFYEVYERARRLDTNIGYEMMKRGVISPEEYGAMQYSHLRRLYEAYENPRAFIKRIEQLAIEPTVGLKFTAQDRKLLIYENLRPLRNSLDSLLTGAHRRADALGAAIRSLPQNVPAPDRLDELFRKAVQDPNIEQQLRAYMQSIPGSPIVRNFDDRFKETQGAAQSFEQLFQSATDPAPRNLDDRINQLFGRVDNLLDEQREALGGVPDLDELFRRAKQQEEARKTPSLLREVGKIERRQDRLHSTDRLSELFSKETARPSPSVLKRQHARQQEFDQLIKDEAAAERLLNFIQNTWETAKDNPYVRFTQDNRVRFDSRRFVTDLNAWMNTNFDANLPQLLDHVKDVMLRGFEPSPDIMKAVADIVTDSVQETITRQGSQYFADAIRSRLNNPVFTWRRVRENLALVAERQDIPDEVKKLLGEILPFGPRIASQASETGRLLEVRKFLDNVLGVERDELGNLLAIQGSDWVATNRDQIKGVAVRIDGAKFGHADQEFWAKPVVAATMQALEGTGYSANETKRLWERLGDAIAAGTGAFKLSKVVMDPGAHVRNIFGNFVLAHLAGINPFRNLGSSIREVHEFYRTGQMGKYMAMAEATGTGLFQHTFSAEELGTLAARLERGGEGRNLSAYEGLERIVQGMMEGWVGRPARLMSNLFQMEEQTFKLVAFRNHFDDMMGRIAKSGGEVTAQVQANVAKQAAELADRAIFNYGDVPLIVDFARKYGIMPFITFPYKATGRVMHTLLTAPHRILAYPRLADGWNGVWNPTSEQVQAEVNALPEHIRDRMVVRLPFKDGYDRAQYLDLGYIAPWFSILEVSNSFKAMKEEGAVLPRDGMFTPPLLALTRMFTQNVDSLGRPIHREGMTPTQSFGAFAKAFLSQVLPPSAMYGSRSESVARAMMALVRTNSETVPAAQGIAFAASPFSNQDRALNRFLQPAQSNTQVSGGGLFPVQDPNVSAVLGALAAYSGVGTTYASDRPQTMRNTLAARDSKLSDIHREIAAIRNNPNIPREEKITRIRRLYEAIAEQKRDAGDAFSRL